MKDRRKMDYTVHVDRPSEQVIPELLNNLERRGLRVMITFDLQLARANQTACRCPHHGTEHCTCQYAVLLVRRQKQENEAIRTITAHGRDEEMWLSMLKAPSLPANAHPAHEALGKEVLEIMLGLASTSRSKVRETSEPVAVEV